MPGQAGGGSFKDKNYISQRKNLPIDCAQGSRPARCSNHFFAVNEPSAVPWWWCDVFWCHEVACGVRWSNVLGCEVTSGELLWLVATWHVMSCHLMCWSCHLMRCDCLCCVMSRDAMRCHVMCAHVKSCHLLCPAMGWNIMSLKRHYALNNYSTTPILLCTTPILFCTTKYYSSTTVYYFVLLLYYKVLLQYYCVLQRTTKYYSGTTLYYKVLLQYYCVLQSTTPVQYYSVLQSTTPVLLRSTKYYSSTTKYSVLQSAKYDSRSTTPVVLCTTKYYSILLRFTKYYYKVLLQYYSVLQSTTPVLLCTTKYYSSTTTNYSALQSTTPVLLCTTKYYSSTTPFYKVLLQSSTAKYYSSTTKYYKLLLRYYFETSFTMRVATRATLQLHQILRLPRKMNLMIDPPRIWKVTYNARNECHQWSASHMKRHFQCAEQQDSPSHLTKYCACHAEWLSWLTVLTYETSFTMRGATGITLQPHQILRLPRKVSVMVDPAHIWNVIYNARSNRHHPPTSPNTAPATQNCTPQSKRNLPKTVEVSFPMRDRSEHDPRPIRPGKRKPQPASPPRVLFALARSTFYWKLQHFPLRLLPRKVTHELHHMLHPHQMLHVPPCHKKWHMNFTNCSPATKSDTWTSPKAAPATKSDTWTSPNAAPATKSHTWTSPDAAPATKSHTWTSPNAAPATKSHTWTSPNAAPATQSDDMHFTKCCTCHEKSHMNFTTKSDTGTSPNAAPATKNDTWTSPNAAPATKSN